MTAGNRFSRFLSRLRPTKSGRPAGPAESPPTDNATGASDTATAPVVVNAAGPWIDQVNEALGDAPELVNSEPYEGGWMVRLKLDDPAAGEVLMDAAAYRAETAG